MRIGVGCGLPTRRILGYTFGAELLQNGDFATDTVWVKGAGWTIALGVATKAAGASGRLSQAITLVVGGVYQLTYTVTSHTTGVLTARLTNAGVTVSSFTSAAAAGTYTSTVVLSGAADELSFSGASAAVFSIDNVSLKRAI